VLLPPGDDGDSGDMESSVTSEDDGRAALIEREASFAAWLYASAASPHSPWASRAAPRLRGALAYDGDKRSA
jgi:hypothetical protein